MSNKLLAVIAGGALLAGVTSAAFSFYNKEPTQEQVKKEFYTAKCVRGFHTTCNLYLSDTIGKAADYYTLQPLIQDLTPSDTVYIHVSGDGGIVQGSIYLLDIFHNSKAQIKTIVEGDVASCHAVLAMGLSKDVSFPADGFIYIHAVSSTNEAATYCKASPPGTDRGISLYTKCLEDTKAITDIYNRTMLRYLEKYLAKDELASVFAGHEVIIGLDEWAARVHSSAGSK